MGERGDIIRTINRELREANIARPPQDHALFDGQNSAAKPVIGKLVAVGLSDEHRDRRYMVVDGVDGRSHHVDIGEDQASYSRGSILRLSHRPAEVREVDRDVARIAAGNDGRYSIDIHLRHDPAITEAATQSHVRRLEAMRRSIGRPERQPDGTWRIGPDHLGDALAHEHRQPHPVQHHRALLFGRLDAHEAHGRSRHRLADRLGIGRVVLAPLYVRLHILRRHQPHIMAQRDQLAGPVMRRRARFDADQARRQNFSMRPRVSRWRITAPPSAFTPCT
jgi:hypothetical protein